MIVVRITLSETRAGLRLTVGRTGKYAASHRETLAFVALMTLLVPLAKRIAADFHARFANTGGTLAVR